MFGTIKRVREAKVEVTKKETTLYAVFEKETEEFLGVGDFSAEEVKSLQNKYVFSKM